MNYYDEIKNELIENETTKKAKDYSKNKSDLMHYYRVGELLIEAQGGEQRAKYGNQIIKEYAKRLLNDLGHGYDETNLKRMRKFYVIVQKGATLSHLLSWSHYVDIITLKDVNQMNYYIELSIYEGLGVRGLRDRIKRKEFERLDSNTKYKLINKEKIEINDFIKNPIIIKNTLNVEEISEKYLKKLIMEDLDSFLRELGIGFLYVGNEYKIKIGNSLNYIDILLFNTEYNSYVVVELKVTELRKEYIGQVQIYMNYVNKYIKKEFHNKTIGLIICKHDNKLVLEYSSDSRIYSTTYELV